jgi:hypothetical protein
MKKIVFLGLVLLLVGSSTGFSQNIPLPKDIEVKVPSPALPKEIAAFSGKWKGTWSGGGADFILVVTEISLEKAEIIYANAEKDRIAAACENITASVIIGDNPKIKFDRVTRLTTGRAGTRSWYTFELQKDLKTLKGILEGPQATLKATLEKTQ